MSTITKRRCNHSQTKSALFAGCAALGLLASPAMAQDAGAGDDAGAQEQEGGLNVIVVTAQKREECPSSEHLAQV